MGAPRELDADSERVHHRGSPLRIAEPVATCVAAVGFWRGFGKLRIARADRSLFAPTVITFGIIIMASELHAGFASLLSIGTFDANDAVFTK